MPGTSPTVPPVSGEAPRVALLSGYHPEIVPGGGQKVAYDLFGSISRTSGTSHAIFVASGRGGDKLGAVRRSGTSIVAHDGQQHEFLWWNDDFDEARFLNQSPRHVSELMQLLIDFDPDVVHIHDFVRLGVDIPALIKARLRAKVVMTLHDYLILCPADGHLLRRTDRTECAKPSPVRCSQCVPWLSSDDVAVRSRWIRDSLSCVDRFFVPSEAARRALLRAGLELDLEVVENGVAPKAVDHPTFSGKEVAFAFFGQVLDDKGIDCLLDATEILEDAEFPWRLTIHGANVEFASKRLRERVKRGLPRGVQSYGRYHDSEVTSLMQRADVVVVPSLWPESFNLVAAEALSAGRPVIASNAGALSERIRHGVNGLLVPPGDPLALARAMQATADEDLRRVLSRGARDSKVRSEEEMFQDYATSYMGRVMTRG